MMNLENYYRRERFCEISEKVSDDDNRQKNTPNVCYEHYTARTIINLDRTGR